MSHTQKIFPIRGRRVVFKGQKNKEGPKGTKSSFSEVAWSQRVNPQENQQDIKESTADKGGG